MFILNITTDSAAFGETRDDCAEECARILRATAGRIAARAPEGGGAVYDLNGNRVGAWSIGDAAPVPSPVAALEAAERFLAGFEGDELQEDMSALGKVRAALRQLRGEAPTAPEPATVARVIACARDFAAPGVNVSATLLQETRDALRALDGEG